MTLYQPKTCQAAGNAVETALVAAAAVAHPYTRTAHPCTGCVGWSRSFVAGEWQPRHTVVADVPATLPPVLISAGCAAAKTVAAAVVSKLVAAVRIEDYFADIERTCFAVPLRWLAA